MRRASRRMGRAIPNLFWTRIMYGVVEHKPARMYVMVRRTVTHAKHVVTPATNPS